jgi:hypothetical protein
VLFGSSSGLPSQWEFDSGQMFGALGPDVDGAGDLNGDGHDDVISGFPESDGERGRLRAFHGSRTGLPLVPDWEVVGSPSSQKLGWGVAFAGDTDDDGYDDVLACDISLVRLYAGSATGLDPEPVWSFPTDWCGGKPERTGPAGDLNGDGYDDVLVGATDLGENQDENGLLVFFGSADGLALEPVEELSWGDGSHSSMAPVGDVNGDGFDDLVVGSPLEDGGGRAFLLLGSEIGLQPQPAWTHDPVPGAYRMGWSVSRAGDVNGDGLVDLVVGDPAAPIWSYGRAVLFLGVQPLGPGPAGTIVPGDAGLTVDRDPDGRVVLAWPGSCLGSPEDYAVYRGNLGSFTDSEPVTCSTGGLKSWTMPTSGGNQYYLVVPRSLDHEGSYGKDGAGDERPPSPCACLPQSIADC